MTQHKTTNPLFRPTILCEVATAMRGLHGMAQMTSINGAQFQHLLILAASADDVERLCACPKHQTKEV